MIASGGCHRFCMVFIEQARTKSGRQIRWSVFDNSYLQIQVVKRVSGSPVEPGPLFFFSKRFIRQIIKLSVMMSGLISVASRLALRTSFMRNMSLSTHVSYKMYPKAHFSE